MYDSELIWVSQMEKWEGFGEVSSPQGAGIRTLNSNSFYIGLQIVKD